MSETSTKSAITGLRLLPKDFSPTVNEVIIGRGRKVTNHIGNERFRDLIYSEIREYEAAETKTAKSAIIFRVLQQIKNASPETGGFVKQDSKSKRWYAVEETTGRTTTAQAFRDALSSNYKSSKQFKQKRRWDRKSPGAPGDNQEGISNNGGVTKQVEILPKIPYTNSAQLAPPRPSNQLGDILNSALETVGDLTSFSPGMANTDHQCAAADINTAATTFCGEPKCTKEMDFDQLVDLLGVTPQATTTACNPFEPTPISPAFAFPNYHQRQQPPTQMQMPLLASQKEYHLGDCWGLNKPQEQQRLDNTFWQESTADPVGSGFSLKQALSNGRHCAL